MKKQIVLSIILILLCLAGNNLKISSANALLEATGNYEAAYNYYMAEANSKEPLDKMSGLRGLAGLYKKGLGREKDCSRAVKFYKKAFAIARQLSDSEPRNIHLASIAASLATDVGELYWYGGPSLAEDNNKAYYWLSDVAYPLIIRSGPTQNANGINLLKQRNCSLIGQCHLYGFGTKKDYKTARRYLTIAANHDNRVAMFKLGSMYEQGLGVDKSIKDALKWYRKAHAKGYKKASEKVNKLSKQMENILLE